MRRIAFPVLVILVLGLLAGPAAAQEKYPSRPIDFVVTWGAGGGADAMARQLGSLSQPLLGVPLPASNVAGASGNTGLAQVLAGKPDGYTLATYIQDTLMTLPMGHLVDGRVRPRSTAAWAASSILLRGMSGPSLAGGSPTVKNRREGAVA
jgi:tripartite-type tricarboxylate transporter receptor subunit TctC